VSAPREAVLNRVDEQALTAAQLGEDFLERFLKYRNVDFVIFGRDINQNHDAWFSSNTIRTEH
jgi:hypothetical protein